MGIRREIMDICTFWKVPTSYFIRNNFGEVMMMMMMMIIIIIRKNGLVL